MAMHRINRVEIELHGGDVQLARALSERVSRMYGNRIAPVLERVCSELSGSEALDRLDQLEVDLGTVAADDFEDDFAARLAQALRAALAAALRRRTAGSDPRTRATLELLETFALTGGLPWWADPQDGEVVARHFAQAVASAGEDLVVLLRRIAHDPGALDRMARMCEPDALVALAERAQVRIDPSPHGVELHERRALLSALAGRDDQPGEAAEPAPRVEARRAVDVTTRDPSTERAHADDRSPDESRTASPPPPRSAGDEAMAAMRIPSAPHARDDDRASNELPPATLPRLHDARRRPDFRDEAQSAHPVTRDDATEVRLAAASRTTDDALPSQPPAERTELEERAAALPGSRAATPSRAATRAAVAPHPLDARRAPSNARPQPQPQSPAAAICTARRGALARLDELYVDDAGLVILWPFLERLFVRTGLVGEDRRFLAELAELQAVALCASLATADPEPLEFRLPLAKLLCGRPLESDFVLENPLTSEQLAEGDRLLAAVIDRAPVLGELSIAGLRTSFLQRPGALTTRDGAWLLQVERRAHDVVLDRFPWSWSWVKLPWMPDLLRVEW